MHQWYKCPKCNQDILYGTNPCSYCQCPLAWSPQGPVIYIPPLAKSNNMVIQQPIKANQQKTSLTMNDLTEKELLELQQEFNRRKKNEVVTWLFWAFLGLLGAHRLYLGKTGSGIIQMFTFGGFVLWTLFDAFLIPSMLREYHSNLNNEIIQQIVSLRKKE